MNDHNSDLLFCHNLATKGFRPWATMQSDIGEVELVSYPYPENNGVYIMARRIVGDCTTMEVFHIIGGRLEATCKI